MDPNKSINDFDKTMEIPVQEHATDNNIIDQTITPMSKSEFLESMFNIPASDDTQVINLEEMKPASDDTQVINLEEIKPASDDTQVINLEEMKPASDDTQVINLEEMKPASDDTQVINLEEMKPASDDTQVINLGEIKPEVKKVDVEDFSDDEEGEEEPTGPRMWVPVLISCVAMIVMCISLITTYVIPVLYENGLLSGMVKIVSPIIGAEEAPKDTNVLLFGVDKDGYRTDTIMIARYDDTAKTVSVIQIPRDTYVGGNGRNDKKINSAYFSGIDQLKTEIKMAYGIDVHKYASVDLEGFRKLVDLLGGVEVNVPINMDYDDPEQNLHIHLKKGTQVLDGKNAEGFVRFRKSNAGIDYNRSLSQKEFMNGMFKKLATPETIMKAPELLGLAGKYLTTDLSYPEIMAYATTILELPEESIMFMDSPGTSGLRGGGWYFFVDKTEAAKIAIQYFGAEPTLSLAADNIPAAAEPEPEETTPEPEPEEEPEEEPAEETEEETSEESGEEAEEGEVSESEPTETEPADEPPAETTPTEKPASTPKPMGTARPVDKPASTPVPASTDPKHTAAPQ